MRPGTVANGRLPARLGRDSDLGAVTQCEQSELGAAVLLKAVWWDLRLASLLTHLFIFGLLFILLNRNTLSGLLFSPNRI